MRRYGRRGIGPCSIYLATPLPLAVGMSSAAGNTSLPLAIPNTPSLVGQGFWLQSLVADPGGQFLGLATLSPGLEVRVGG